MAASGAADGRLCWVAVGGVVAVMRGLAPTAGALRRDRGLQRSRQNRSDERE